MIRETHQGICLSFFSSVVAQPVGSLDVSPTRIGCVDLSIKLTVIRASFVHADHLPFLPPLFGGLRRPGFLPTVFSYWRIRDGAVRGLFALARHPDALAGGMEPKYYTSYHQQVTSAALKLNIN